MTLPQSSHLVACALRALATARREFDAQTLAFAASPDDIDLRRAAQSRYEDAIGELVRLSLALYPARRDQPADTEASHVS